METKRKKKFIKYSLKVVFKFRRILKNIKIQTKLFYVKYEIFYFRQMLDRYSLASRAFPKTKNPVVCTEFSVGSKLHFFQWKISFCQFIFIDEYLIFEGIEYLIHYIKFEL